MTTTVKQMEGVVGWAIGNGLSKLIIEFSGCNNQSEITDIQFIDHQTQVIRPDSNNQYHREIVSCLTDFLYGLADRVCTHWSKDEGGYGALKLNLSNLMAYIDVVVYLTSDKFYDLEDLLSEHPDRLGYIREFAEEVIGLFDDLKYYVQLSFGEDDFYVCSFAHSYRAKIESEYYRPVTDERILQILSWLDEEVGKRDDNIKIDDGGWLEIRYDFDLKKMSLGAEYISLFTERLSKEIDLPTLFEAGDFNAVS